eukprot:35672-Chlamydomonas_euryale.AAC.2
MAGCAAAGRPVASLAVAAHPAAVCAVAGRATVIASASGSSGPAGPRPPATAAQTSASVASRRRGARSCMRAPQLPAPLPPPQRRRTPVLPVLARTRGPPGALPALRPHASGLQRGDKGCAAAPPEARPPEVP